VWLGVACASIFCFALVIFLAGVARQGPRFSPWHRHVRSNSNDRGMEAPDLHPNRPGLTVDSVVVTNNNQQQQQQQQQQHSDSADRHQQPKRPQSAGELHEQVARQQQRVRHMQAALENARIKQQKILPDQVTHNLPDQGFADVERLNAVRDAIRHSWNGYAEHCFGQDEVNPVSGTCENWLNQGNTLIDSLDTLWIAGLKTEFARAREWVANSLSQRLQANVYVSFFESTIRILGGLLATYGLTNDEMFLQKVSAFFCDCVVEEVNACSCKKRMSLFFSL
jgi:hypothetical protein